ncbi:MAG: sugar phosphate isomerase/epimerase, partial [Zymomonas sp.]
MSSPATDLVRFAAEAGCQAVSVFTNCPDAVLPGQSKRLEFPTITSAAKREMQGALAQYGVKVVGVEYFPILPDLDVREYIPGLALGAELGGTRAVTHIHD